MSALGVMLRLIVSLVKSEAVSQVARSVIRSATAEVVRAIRRGTTHKGKPTFS